MQQQFAQRDAKLGDRLRAAVYLLAFMATPAIAGPQDSSGPLGDPSLNLVEEQLRVSQEYVRLEKLLLRMAEFDHAANPQRAEVLRKALSLGKQRDVRGRLHSLVDRLRDEQFGSAVSDQKRVRRDLAALLKVLLAEDRAGKVKRERTRIRDYIREIERLERLERSVLGRTEGGVAELELSDEQRSVAERAASLERQIEEDEARDQPRGEASGEDPAAEQEAKPTPSQETPSDDPPPTAPAAPSDNQSDESKPSQDHPRPSDSDAGEPPSTPPSDSPPGPPSTNQPPPPGQDPANKPSESLPGQQNLKRAREAMQRATEKLQRAQREEALQAEREATKELAEAKAKLEEILRQLREEEIERTLTMLESRVKQMLEMEVGIREETIRLDAALRSDNQRGLEIEAGKLGFQQRRVVSEADKALAILQEEGSSIAFPETLGQAREDMIQVADRLARTQLGSVTQAIEDDVISALEEMLAALKQAQAEQRQRQQAPGPPQAGSDEQALVDQIAELRMIKSLQLRINHRTLRYSQLLGNPDDPVGQATDAELMEALQSLADREARLHQITRDLVLGKNQ